MARMVSLQEQWRRICELEEDDLDEWEQDFVRNVKALLNRANGFDDLSERRIEAIERLYRKHFGD